MPLRLDSPANVFQPADGHRCPVWGERLEFALDGRDTELQVEVTESAWHK